MPVCGSSGLCSFQWEWTASAHTPSRSGSIVRNVVESYLNVLTKTVSSVSCCVHLNLLTSLDAALRQFISCRGTLSEVLSYQGMNFRGVERELKRAFTPMGPKLQKRLAKQHIRFRPVSRSTLWWCLGAQNTVCQESSAGCYRHSVPPRGSPAYNLGQGGRHPYSQTLRIRVIR